LSNEESNNDGVGNGRFDGASASAGNIQAALPWLIYGYTEIIGDPLVVDLRCPPWLRYGGSMTIRTALQPADLQVSPDSQ